MKKYLCGILIISIILMPMTALSAEEVLGIKTQIEKQLIINEVMIGSEVNPIKDVWIEFFNPTKKEVKLDGWQIRGITKSGRWVGIVNKSDLTIKPDGYFLLSYYSNSKSSALDVKPQMQKSSLTFPNASIEIELKDPDGNLGDKAVFIHNKSDEFKSYERKSSASDGSLSASWSRATKQVNLKDGLKKTFATPGSPIVDPIGDPTLPAGRQVKDPVGDPIEDSTETKDKEKNVGDGHVRPDDEQTNITPTTATTNTTNTTTKTAEGTENNRNDTLTDTATTSDDAVGTSLDLSSNEKMDITPTTPITDEANIPTNTPTDIDGQKSETDKDTTYTGLIGEGNKKDAESVSEPTEKTDTVETIDTVGTRHALSNDEQITNKPTDEPAEETTPPTKTDTTIEPDAKGEEKNVGDGHAYPTNDDIKNKPDNQTTETTTKIVYPTHKLINEILPNPEGSDTEKEWIELFNSTDSPIDLSGWYLDDADGASAPYQIKNKTILNANEYKVFSAPDINLSLKNTDDQVRLLAPDKSVKEIIDYSSAKENFSYIKKDNGEFEWTNILTPNAKNQLPPPPRSYKTKNIVFNNVIANPDGSDTGNEKITIKNNLNEIIKLDKWKLKNKSDKEFAITGISINANEKLTFNPSKINLTLTNTSDTLSLIDPAGNLIDQINWTNAGNGKKIYKSDFFKDGTSTKVTRVIDGDTIIASVNNEEFNIRLIGIDTPETVHPVRKTELLGIKASNYLDNLLRDKNVVLNFDNTKMDTYNRLLAYIYLEDQFVNAEIIRNGYGYAYTKFPFKYQLNFLNYETDAMEKGLGVWEKTVISSNTITISNNIVGDADLHPQNDEIDITPTTPTIENDDIDPKIDTVSDELPEKNVNIENDDKKSNKSLKTTHDNIKCSTKGLKIHSILPNPNKNSDEYIKIANISDKTVCFNGWKLDDQTSKGSKPFKIKGGGVEASAIRTFFKSETKLALNNTNDCANLINPSGDIVDTICYNKTHAGEVFTHDGGDWAPNQKATSANVATKKTKTTRPPENYKWGKSQIPQARIAEIIMSTLQTTK